MIERFQKKAKKNDFDTEDVLGNVNVLFIWNKKSFTIKVIILIKEKQLAKEKIANWEKAVVANELVLNTDIF